MIYNPQYPYIYPPENPNIFQIQEEIKRIKFEISKLKEQLNNIEQSNKSDYLKKDDNFYIM